jgi:predicted RNA-binding Zn ribbon-like protein
MPRRTPMQLHLSSSISAIPHTLSEYLCIDFVNSRFAEHTGTGQVFDRLPLPEWQFWFAHRCGLAIKRPATSRSRHDLLHLRHLLRSLLESGQAPDETSLAALNRVMSLPSQRWALSRGKQGWELAFIWKPQDWGAVMAATVASYAQLLVTGGIARVKVCANPACTYMFYDDTRNRSRRWCNTAQCGTLVRVRHHRAHTGGATPAGRSRRPGQTSGARARHGTDPTCQRASASRVERPPAIT